MLEVVRHNSGVLKAFDDWWALEQALLHSLCGASAETRASTKILLELPTAERHITLQQSLQRLEAMEGGQAIKMSPAGVSAALRFIVKNIGQLQLGIGLTDMKTCSALARRALQNFQFFLVCPDPKKKGSVLKGEAAYALMWSDVQKATAAAAEQDGQVLEDLETYRWLAAPGSEVAIADFLVAYAKKQESKGGAKKAKGGGSSASGAASSSKDGAKKAKVASSGKEAAMRYFSCFFEVSLLPRCLFAAAGA